MVALAMFAVGLAGTTQACCSPVHAGDKVTPELVATVQKAIRRKAPRWSQDRAAAVAKAMNETPVPALMLAISVLESDLRPSVIAWHGHVADVGLMGVRCVLGPGSSVTAREFRSRSAGTLTARRETAVPAGRCQVGPARGFTLRQLQDPVRNIKIAGQLLERKRKSLGSAYLRGYHGSSNPRDPYASWVEAVIRSFGGCEVKVEYRRVRGLIRKIAAELSRARRS